jgi:hypothetical protein
MALRPNFTSMHRILAFWVLMTRISGLCLADEIDNSFNLGIPSTPASTAPDPTPATADQVQFMFDTLAGQLPPVIRAQAIPYLVVNNIEVPAGKTVTIEKGTVLLFKNFTGLHVEGTLFAQGSAESPILFTSENDQSMLPGGTLLPNPFDWDGVYIHAGAIGTTLSNCTVAYSVYGVVSETKFIRLDPIVFKYNGKCNLTIEGVVQKVPDGFYTHILSVKDARVDGVPVKILRDPLAIKRNSLRFVGLAASAAGVGRSIYCRIQWRTRQEALSAISTDDPAMLKNHPYGSEWKETRDARDTWRTETLFTAIIAVIGAAGFGLSFTF